MENRSSQASPYRTVPDELNIVEGLYLLCVSSHLADSTVRIGAYMEMFELHRKGKRNERRRSK